MNLNKSLSVFVYILIGAIAGFLGSTYVSTIQNQDNADVDSHEEAHYHAAFRVFNDGEFVDLSDIKYMHVEPCSQEEEHEDEEEHDHEAHMHDDTGMIVHVHGDDSTWGDFFETIGYEISEGTQAYDGNEFVDDIFDQIIHHDERILFIEGEETEELDTIFEHVPDQEAIHEAERQSESCGK